MHSPTLIGASYLMLIRVDEILMARRFQTGFEDGKYSLPAGHLEVGETFTQTLLRETKEEIGIKLQPECVKLAHIMHRYAIQKTGHDERVDVFFEVREWQGEPEIREPDKCDHIQWFSYSDLPVKTIPYIREAIECWKNGIMYSEFGFH